MTDHEEALWRIVYWGHSADESEAEGSSFLEMLATAENALGLEYDDADVRLSKARTALGIAADTSANEDTRTER